MPAVSPLPKQTSLAIPTDGRTITPVASVGFQIPPEPLPAKYRVVVPAHLACCIPVQSKEMDVVGQSPVTPGVRSSDRGPNARGDEPTKDEPLASPKTSKMAGVLSGVELTSHTPPNSAFPRPVSIPSDVPESPIARDALAMTDALVLRGRPGSAAVADAVVVVNASTSLETSGVPVSEALAVADIPEPEFTSNSPVASEGTASKNGDSALRDGKASTDAEDPPIAKDIDNMVVDIPEVPQSQEVGDCQHISDVINVPDELEDPQNDPRGIKGCGADESDSCQAVPADVVILTDSPGARKIVPPPSLPSNGKRLHSFFTQPPAVKQKMQHIPSTANAPSVAAAGAMAAVRDRAGERASKRKRGPPPPVDPWASPDYATIHVNAPGTIEKRPESGSAVSVQVRRQRFDFDSLSDPFWNPPVGSRRESLRDMTSSSGVECGAGRSRCQNLWSDTFRRPILSELDKLGADRRQNFVSWLSTFFNKKKSKGGGHEKERKGYASSEESSESESDGGDAAYHFCAEDESDQEENGEEFENVALIDGPVGCGKSTLVSQAADMLGLDILEVNCSTCRTGRRIKEIVGEALVTHRVRGKSLVVFEEVDCLHEDEKGFWAAIVELSRRAGRRRPIVLTANKITSEMERVLGGDRDERSVLVNTLVGSPRIDTEPELMVKRFNFEPTSGKQVYVAITAVCKAMGRIKLPRQDRRTIAGLHSDGDLRGALNAVQFWSMPGKGGIAAALDWPEEPEDLNAVAFTKTPARLYVVLNYI